MTIRSSKAAIRIGLATICMVMVFSNSASGQIQVNPASSDCNCDGTLTFSTGQSTNTFFAWYDSDWNLIQEMVSQDGQSMVSGLCPGVYWLQVNDGDDEETFFANIPGTTNPGTAVSDTLCHNEGNFNLSSLMPDIASGGIWHNSSGQIVDDLQNAGQIFGTEVFTYTISNGACDVSTIVEITIVENASAGLSTTYLICENYVPFQMTDVLTGNPSENGTWLNMNGVELDGWYYPEIMNGGLFTYMVDEVAICDPVFSSLFIIENTIGNPGEDSTVLLCSNSPEVELFNLIGGNPDAGGYWLNSLGQPVSNFLIPAPGLDGNYTYVLPGETPCPAQFSTVEVSFTAFNPAGVDGAIAACEDGGMVNLMDFLGGSPFSDGTWQSPSGTMTAPELLLSDSETGSYTYIVQDSDCPADSAFVQLNIDLHPQAGDDISVTTCGAYPINLNDFLSSGTSSGAWFMNDSPIGNPEGLELVPGQSNLLFVAQSSNGLCPADTSFVAITAEEPPTPLFDGELALCANPAPIDLANLTGLPAQVIWSTEGNTLSGPTVLDQPGTFQFAALLPSGNSCPDETSEITITVELELFDESISEVQLCYDGNDSDLYEIVDISVETGQWFDQQGNELVNGVVAGNPTGIYMLVSSEEHVCGADTLWIELQSFDFTSVGSDIEFTLCENSDALLWEEMTEVSGVFQVYFGEEIVGTYFNPETMLAGEYQIISLADGPCPADTAIVSVAILPAMTFEAGPDIYLCEGTGSVELGQPAESGCTYQWIPSLNLNNNLVSNPEFSPEEVASSPWTQEYVVVVSNEYCSTSDSLSVTIYPEAWVDINAPSVVCSGEQVNAEIQGNLSAWTWTVNEIFTQEGGNLSLLPESTLQLGVLGTNEWGCSTEDLAVISVAELPQALITNLPEPSCSPIELNIQAEIQGEQAVEVNWYVGEQWVGSGEWLDASWTFEGEQELVVLLENEAGCHSEIVIEGGIVVFPAPDALIAVSSEVSDMFHPDVEFIDISIGADQREWTLPDGSNTENQTFTYTFPQDSEQNHLFVLEVWNEFGCSDTSSVIIRTESEQVFYAPNSFTPDNDGINEIFKPVFEGYDKESYSLGIYDRWGIEIFKTNDPEEGWKGDNQKGNYYVQQDVYNWKVTLRVAGSADYDTFSGIVTVIR